MRLIPLRHAADVRTSSVDKHAHDGEIPVRLCNYVDVYRNDKVAPSPDSMLATATSEEIERFRLLRGDTVLTKDSEDPSDIGISAYVEDTDPDFVCGYHLAIARPKSDVHPRYLTWALRSRPALHHLSAHATGISRYGLAISDLGSTPLPWLEIEEQRRVADFLDDRVDRIDRIIAARRSQIGLLREEEQAIREALVWGGLDPSEERRKAIDPALDSPSRWLRMANRYLFQERVALSESGEEELLSVSHLTGVTPRSEKNVTMFMAESLEGYKRVQPNDLVINTLWAWMGALAVSDIEGIVSPAYGVYRPLKPLEMLPAYFDSLFRSSAYICEMTRNSKGVWSSRLRLYPESFLGLRSVLPPVEEQVAIMNEIDVRVGGNAARASYLSRSIDLLTEYKQSLITAAVTGELDVTTAGSGIPR